MPVGTRVHRCVQHLKGRKGVNAYAVCQKATGQSYATGKSLKKPKSYMPSGMGMSPSGDIGNARVKEADKVFPSMKNAGGHDSGSARFGSGIKEPGKIGEKNSNGGVTA